MRLKDFFCPSWKTQLATLLHMGKPGVQAPQTYSSVGGQQATPTAQEEILLLPPAQLASCSDCLASHHPRCLLTAPSFPHLTAT